MFFTVTENLHIIGLVLVGWVVFDLLWVNYFKFCTRWSRPFTPTITILTLSFWSGHYKVYLRNYGFFHKFVLDPSLEVNRQQKIYPSELTKSTSDCSHMTDSGLENLENAISKGLILNPDGEVVKSEDIVKLRESSMVEGVVCFIFLFVLLYSLLFILTFAVIPFFGLLGLLAFLYGSRYLTDVYTSFNKLRFKIKDHVKEEK